MEKNRNASAEPGQVEELLDRVYRFSRSAMYREIAHSINNSLTGLSMQHGMLMNSLRSGDLGKAMKRGDSLGGTIEKLKAFSGTLAADAKITPESADIAVNSLIADTLSLARRLAILSPCEITLDLCEEDDVLNIDPDSIRVLLLIFLKLSTSVYSEPMVSIRSQRMDDRKSFCIYASAEEGQSSQSPKLDIPTTIGPELGQIPLSLLKRIIQSLNKNIDLSFPDSDELGFTCIISS